MIWVTAALASPLELADRVERDRIEHTMQVLTGVEPLDGEPVVSRNIHHPDHDRVRDWLAVELDAVQEDFRAERTDCANLVAVIPGTTDGPPILLGAHYDSTANLEDGYDAESDPAPGADDNASGVAVLVEAARVLRSYEGTFERSIHLVAFDAEEQGLHGAIHHVDQLTEPIELALILDPVGHNPGSADWLFVAFDARWEQVARDLEATALDLGDIDVGAVDHESFGGDDRSDHAPFWWADLPALHAGTYPLPPAYHTADDTLDGVDVDFVHAVARLSVAHVAGLAGASAPPVDEEPGLCATGALPVSLTLLVLSVAAVRRSRP